MDGSTSEEPQPTACTTSGTERNQIEQLCAKLEQLSAEVPPLTALGEAVGGQIELSFDEPIKGCATLTVSASAKRNAISAKMISQLVSRLDELYLWSAGRVLLSRGANGMGSDLTDARRSTQIADCGLWLAQTMGFVFNRIQQLPMLTVALIEGYALGGGAELALACDMRLFEAGKLCFGGPQLSQPAGRGARRQ